MNARSRPSHCAPPGAAREGGDLHRLEGALAVRVGNRFAPGRAQAQCPDFGRKSLGAAGVRDPQPVQGIEHWMTPSGLPRQATHAREQRAHRGNGVDESLPDDRCSSRRTLSTAGGYKIAQACTKLGIWHGVISGEIGDLLKQLLVLLRPIKRRNTVGALPPQVSHAALKHEDDLIGRGEQAVTQEATQLERSCRLLDPRAYRRRPCGRAPGVAAHQLLKSANGASQA